MAQNYRAFVEADPERAAIIAEEGTVSRAQFDERVNRLIHGLRSLGVGTGDVIGLLCHNRAEWLEVAQASGHAGMGMVPLNWHLTADELAYILTDSGAKAILADTTFREVAAQAAAASGVGVQIAIGDAPGADVVRYEELLAAMPADEPEDQTAGSLLPYTSGTTGQPKGVRATTSRLGGPVEVVKAGYDGLAMLVQFPDQGTAFVNAPLYHGGPLMFGALPFLLGHTIVLRRKFDPAETLRLIDEHRVTTAYFVPTHFVRLLKLDDETRRSFDGSSLRAVYHTAAPCPPDVKRRMIEWWGPVIYELYAATESGGLGGFLSSEDWLKKPGSVGRALPACEILVLDDDGNRLETGEVGTIYIRNLIGGDFEYHGDGEKTAKAHLEPGVMTVGDVGYLDEDGYLFLSDRKIDMIISGGVNIYPAEIESVLIAHPKVEDVAVFGVPNEDFGEEVKAVVQPVPGVEIGDELAKELNVYARETLAGYKVPRSFDFAETLPRTPTGKLLKRELRDPYWAATGRTI